MPATRVAAGSIAVRLQRAAREVVRAMQAADEGTPEVLVFLLHAELDVSAVAATLARLRREVVGDVIEGGCRTVTARRHAARDRNGRFTKVSDLQGR